MGFNPCTGSIFAHQQATQYCTEKNLARKFQKMAVRRARSQSGWLLTPPRLAARALRVAHPSVGFFEDLFAIQYCKLFFSVAISPGSVKHIGEQKR